MIPAVLGAALLLGTVRAQVPPGTATTAEAPTTYALVVGSNQAGAGQKPLQHALDDADRVRDVLVELGGVHPVRIEELRDPDPEALLERLDTLTRQIAWHETQDEDTVLLFYYSGHAKSQALELGDEQLPLAELKSQLEGAGADLTLVILDACQAGAISGVKGVEPTADFSHNATAGLNVEGLAVMASSSASELSQESTELGGSYFTHHLVTGLRGAADLDRDGRITLTEAHHYAYHRTLVSTAATAIGRQHVTLETDLRGRGEAVLTHPGQASALLRFEAPLAAEVLIHRAEGEVVVAELHKASGSPVTLAMVPGDYEALVRQGEQLRRCEMSLASGTTAFSTKGCRKVRVVADVDAKGGQIVDNRLERLMLESSLGVFQARESDYTQRLGEFGFEDGAQLFPSMAITGTAVWSFQRNLAGLVTVGNLDMDLWSREFEHSDAPDEKHVYHWETWRAALAARASLPLLRGWFTPYVQAGGGPALGLSTYEDRTEHSEEMERHWGLHLTGAAGLQLMPTFGTWRHVGLFNQVEFSWAPVMENLLGDKHDGGGLMVSLGVRAGF